MANWCGWPETCVKPERLLRRWRRRHVRLLTALPDLLRRSRARGEAEDVHQLRVILRRLRLSVRLGKGAFAEEDVARLRVWGARISQATCPVRDFDIAVEWLQAGKVSPALVQECQKNRDSVWRRRRRLLPRMPAWLAARLVRPPGGRKRSAWLVRRQRTLENRYREAIRRDLPRFFQLGEAGRHEFRRVVRWWRYLREQCLPGRKLARDGLLRRLLTAQETLGTLQNLALVEARFQKLTPSAELGELRPLLARQQKAQLVKAHAALAGLKSRLG